MMSDKFLKWPSIELLHNVRKTLSHYDTSPVVAYTAKVKLHGTNAAVIICPDGTIQAQSRTQIITPKNDNAGFAAWVKSTEAYWRSLVSDSAHVYVYGEWCGKGIQKGTALNDLPGKIFAVFAMGTDRTDLGEETLVVDPNLITRMMSNYEIPPHEFGIFVLPWLTWAGRIMIQRLDFSDGEALTKAAANLTSIVEMIEEEDPWVLDTFSVSGIGEGMVLYPDLGTPVPTRSMLERYMVKVKGTKHSVVKAKTVVEIDPEVLENANAFVERFVTEARLEQIAAEISEELDNKFIGPFIGKFSKDVQKESVPELEASGLEWKDVAKIVSTNAREWYLAKLKTFD